LTFLSFAFDFFNLNLSVQIISSILLLTA